MQQINVDFIKTFFVCVVYFHSFTTKSVYGYIENGLCLIPRRNSHCEQNAFLSSKLKSTMKQENTVRHVLQGNLRRKVAGFELANLQLQSRRLRVKFNNFGLQTQPSSLVYFVAKEILMTERTYVKDLEVVCKVS